ncbi:MAG: hypothetical protein LBJ87_13905, partial [bacterium]|nr:hypothetical protein [bacterium]
PLLGGLTGAAAPLLGGLTGAVAPLLGGVIGAVAPLLGGLTGAVAPLLGGVNGAVAAPLGGVSGAVAPLLGGVSAAPSALPGGVTAVGSPLQGHATGMAAPLLGGVVSGAVATTLGAANTVARVAGIAGLTIPGATRQTTSPASPLGVTMPALVNAIGGGILASLGRAQSPVSGLRGALPIPSSPMPWEPQAPAGSGSLAGAGSGTPLRAPLVAALLFALLWLAGRRRRLFPPVELKPAFVLSLLDQPG